MLKFKANYTATQARFQQKQLQEKEQKLLQLYDQQQQRAYQVVQRGSAGSNGSNHGSTIRTTTTTHTTSTSQGGKVRQMFDERRQTTVKGIDRSYPLEPLENKLRKQAPNGLTSQRNGNLTTVNRQSVNVKRVARADVNSNVNGGKPVVSYREEVTRESLGPSLHRHDDEDEFGAENRVTNGHHRHDLDNEEEALDQEMIERNRMMAKIHLMGFDESLKHRVRNDLESEEFPDYLMVDVPDKLPKRSVTKKLSQAEARLERFKNANAKRSSNNNAPKQSTTSGAATKRRTEQMLPARSNSRGSEVADGTCSRSTRSGSSRTPPIRAVDRPYIVDDEASQTRRESPDVETLRWSDSPRGSLEKAGTAEATWGIYSPDNYYKSLTSEGQIIMRRGASPRFRKNMNFRSASADRETRASRSISPEFFCKEGERSATTMLIDRKGSSHDWEILQQDRGIEETATSIDRKYAEITRSQSPRFFSRESGESDVTMSLDRKDMSFRSASADRYTPETRASRSTSPQFFRRENEKSTTTMMINERARRPTVSSRNREILTLRNKRIKGTSSIDRKYAEIVREKRSSSPSFFLRNYGKSGTTRSVDRTDIGLRSLSADRQTHETRTSPSTSPEFFCREGERSATTMMTDRRESMSPRDREILTQKNRRIDGTSTTSIDRKYAKIAREKRLSNPPFFLRSPEKSGAAMKIDRTDVGLRSVSADRQTRVTCASPSTSPEFFCKEGEKSATTMTIDRRGSTLSRGTLTQQHKQTKRATISIDRKYADIMREKRSSSPFFFKGSAKSGVTTSIDRKNINYRSTSADRQTRETRASRSSSREFFCKEGERSDIMIDRRGFTSPRNREILTQKNRRIDGTSTTSIDRKYAEVIRDKGSSSPQFFCRESEKSATTMLIEPKSNSMDTTKSILKQSKYTSDNPYKQPTKSSSLRNKGARVFTRVRHTSSPPMIKSRVRRNLRTDQVSGTIVRSDSRKSSKISDTPATSTSSIASLKYGLEFDNLLQSTGLVRKFMKTQNGKKYRTNNQLPLKRDIRNVSEKAVRNGQPKNRYKVSPLFQKSRSPSVDSKEKTTPEYSRKCITPTEIDMEIQEITMTDHCMERYKSQKSSSPEQSSSRVFSPSVSSSLRKITPPKRDCGRQHGAKTRFSSLGKTARRGVRMPKFPRKITDQGEDYASKYATYTIKGRKRQSVLGARKGSSGLSESKSEESKDAGGFSKVTLMHREDESGKDIGRMSVQESATRHFDLVAVGFEHSARASPEISLRTIDVQTKASAEELKARSTIDSTRKVTSDTTLRSTLRTWAGKDQNVGNMTRKNDLKTIPSKIIRSSRLVTKTYRGSSKNKLGSTTQRRSPACKRQLFESDSKKQVQKEKVRTNWNFAKTRENYPSVNVRSRRDQATSKVKSLEELDIAKRSRSASEETPMVSVKSLRSIEDIRKSIGGHERDVLTAAKRSRSAIAYWHSSTARKSGDARRSISASGAAKRADEPMRLIKVQSCVSRITKSPSPDASPSKQHETNARPRGSTPSSPSKSPDINIITRRGPMEVKGQDARPVRRPVAAKAAESIGSKMTSEAMEAVDGVVRQDDSPYESSAKKSFVIDLDDRPKESDTTLPKKVTSTRRSSNDKNQIISSATGRPASSVLSNSGSAGTTQSQATKSRMATKAKTSVSGGSQAKGSSSARNMGNANSADNLISCNTCGRNFAQDRISLHEKICVKTMNKKRKQFDAMTFRVRGTELEPFAKKGLTKKQESHAKKPELKSNWRRKHEEFIEAIRSAKMVQSHLAAGGSLKDLPPPPPSDTSDYIQCPHCGRRFNQAAAERHIPKCEHMLHNKPAHARAARPRR